MIPYDTSSTLGHSTRTKESRRVRRHTHPQVFFNRHYPHFSFAFSCSALNRLPHYPFEQDRTSSLGFRDWSLRYPPQFFLFSCRVSRLTPVRALLILDTSDPNAAFSFRLHRTVFQPFIFQRSSVCIVANPRIGRMGPLFGSGPAEQLVRSPADAHLTPVWWGSNGRNLPLRTRLCRRRTKGRRRRMRFRLQGTA